MTKTEVQQILGTPFHFSKAQKRSIDKEKETVEFSENSSHDGKFKAADFAWEAFEIYYDKDTLVIAKKRQWFYD